MILKSDITQENFFFIYILLNIEKKIMSERERKSRITIIYQ